jgi:ribonuclease Z
MAKVFEVVILGSGSAKPTKRRLPSGQVLRMGPKQFLIDCGEGSQLQMMRKGIKFNNIQAIFISHLHGDHIFGLPGYITTLSLHNRTKKLNIYGPPGIEDLIKLVLHLGKTTLSFDIEYIIVPKQAHSVILDDFGYRVHAMALKHRVECYGYVFEEIGPRRSIIKQSCEAHKVPLHFFEKLRMGEDFVLPSGEVIPNSELTNQAAPARKYAYMSDTIYDPSIVPHIADVNLLYHESTFLHELAARAKETYHSTSKQAGEIAKMANVKKLLLGHFSSRYNEVNELLEEAKLEFENTDIAEEGHTYTIN